MLHCAISFSVVFVPPELVGSVWGAPGPIRSPTSPCGVGPKGSITLLSGCSHPFPRPFLFAPAFLQCSLPSLSHFHPSLHHPHTLCTPPNVRVPDATPPRWPMSLPSREHWGSLSHAVPHTAPHVRAMAAVAQCQRQPWPHAGGAGDTEPVPAVGSISPAPFSSIRGAAGTGVWRPWSFA